MRPRYPTAVFRVALPLLLLLAPLARAQAAFEQMRGLLDRGYYNSAAQLNGPDLVARYPEEAEAHYLFARALYLTGSLDAAAGQLEKATQLAGSSVNASYVHLGGLLKAASGDPQGALRGLQNAFLRTQDYDYAMDWGRVAWQAGAYQEALQAFQAAAATETGHNEMWPHLDRGRLYMFLGAYQDAITELNAAIDVFEATDPGGGRPGSPAYVEAFYRLGEAYEQLGDLDQAETNYRSARTADPNYAPAIAALDRLSRSFD